MTSHRVLAVLLVGFSAAIFMMIAASIHPQTDGASAATLGWFLSSPPNQKDLNYFDPDTYWNGTDFEDELDADGEPAVALITVASDVTSETGTGEESSTPAIATSIKVPAPAPTSTSSSIPIASGSTKIEPATVVTTSTTTSSSSTSSLAALPLSQYVNYEGTGHWEFFGNATLTSEEMNANFGPDDYNRQHWRYVYDNANGRRELLSSSFLDVSTDATGMHDLMMCLAGHRIHLHGNSVMRGLYMTLKSAFLKAAGKPIDWSVGDRLEEKSMCGQMIWDNCETHFEVPGAAGHWINLTYFWTQGFQEVQEKVSHKYDDPPDLVAVMVGLHFVFEQSFKNIEQALAVVRREGPALSDTVREVFSDATNNDIVFCDIPPFNPSPAMQFKPPPHVKYPDDIIAMNRLEHEQYASKEKSGNRAHVLDQFTLIDSARGKFFGVFPVDGVHPGILGREAQAAQLASKLCHIVKGRSVSGAR